MMNVAIIKGKSIVNLYTTEHNVREIKKNVEPFMEVKVLGAPTEGDWLVTTERKIIKKYNESEFEEIYTELKNEPDQLVLFNGEKKIIYIDKPEENEWLIQNVLRYVRTILRLLEFQENNIYVHGGMVSVNGKGIAFLGGKKAGKTSSVLSLASQLGSKGSYVSNDDLSLIIKNENIEGVGWPRAISIRKDSMLTIKKTYPKTFSSVLTYEHPYNKMNDLTNFENLNTMSESDKLDINAHLYPSELVRELNCNILSNEKVNVIVFPEFDSNIKEFSVISELPQSEGLDKLIENIEFIPVKYSDHLMPYFSIPTKEEMMKNVMAITGKIKFISLKQNFSSLKTSSKLLIEFVEQS